MRTLYLLTILVQLVSVMATAQGFIQNQGQWKGPFDYKLDIKGGTVFLEDGGITFHFVDNSGVLHAHNINPSNPADNIIHHHAFKFRFLGSNTNVQKSTSWDYDHYVNYFLGADDTRWKSNITPAHEVTYHNLYDGIDFKIIENKGRIKYEFHLDPGADPRQIRIKTEGLDDLKHDRHGNLLLVTSILDVMEKKPVVFQERGKKKWEIEAEFVLAGNTISYSLADYDSTLGLIIDPELVFSTFSGSTSDNWGFTATPDKLGFVYTGSATAGIGYPTTSGAYDVSFNGTSGQVPGDATITKYDTTGTAQIWSTYLGGEDNEIPHSMIVDDAGNLFVFGTTSSDDFPTTTGAADRTHAGGDDVTPNFNIRFQNGADLFVAKLNSSGSSLLGSTYLGGPGTDGLNLSSDLNYNYADEARGEINLDNNGNVVIVSSTTSTNFIGSSLGFQPTKGSTQDGIIIKLRSDLTQVIWSSYFGGDGDDACYGVAIAQDNSMYITGGTNSTDLPVQGTAFQTAYNGGVRCDGYIAHIGADGKTIPHCTYFGTTQYDQTYLIQLDRQDHPHVFGQTQHAGTQFIFNAAFNDEGGGQILAHFRPDLESVVWSTQFGSTVSRPNISPTAFLVDVCNSMYLTGWGGSTQQNGNNSASDVGGLPITNNAYRDAGESDDEDFYIAVLDADANTLAYGSFFGGNGSSGEHVDGGTSRFDRSGKVYQAVCAGCGGSDDFPTQAKGANDDPWSSANGSSNCNSAVFKFDFELPIILADFQAPRFGCAPFTVNFNNQSLTQNATSFIWLADGVPFSTGANPSQVFTQSGTYNIQLVVNDPNSCNLTDTTNQLVVVKTDTAYTLPDIDTCVGTPVAIGPLPSDIGNISGASINWAPAAPLNDPGSINPIATVFRQTQFQLVIDYGGCKEVIRQTVIVDTFPIRVSEDTIVCSNFSPFLLKGSAHGIAEVYAWSDLPDFSNILSTDTILEVDELTEAINLFYFRATKPNGCSMYDTIKVTVSDYDFHLTNDTFVCKNDDVTIQALSQNSENTFYYYWTKQSYTNNPNQDLLTDSTNSFLVLNEDQPVTYHVYAESRKVLGCTVQDSVFINVSDLDRSQVIATAEKDTFYIGEKVQLTGEPDAGFYHFWTPGTFLSDSTIANPVAQPKKAMTYVYTVSDRNVPQCSFKDSVTIRPYEIICGEPEVFLPTAFSPNGDGLNDELFLRGRHVKTLDLAVYDRWGKLMFDTQDQSKGWDGTFKGAPVENAVYVYYFEVTCIDEQRFFRKGNITVYSK